MALHEYEYLIFLGRFQPCHAAHIEIIKTACEKAQKVIILIGSSSQALTIKNPWTWEQRVNMISLSLEPEELSSIEFRPIYDDMYNNQRWATHVQKTVEDITTGSQSVGMIGHTKDDTSFYLSMFPQWNHVEMPNIDDLHATDIRKALFELSPSEFSETFKQKLPLDIYDYLMAWWHKTTTDQLKEEYRFIEAYKTAWDMAPYEPTFVTTDAVVIQSGHVLLIRRKAAPGKNLWALPGGFINPSELIENGMIRELREETKIKVPEPVLRGNIKDSFIADNPNRSLRGRTISHVFLIELPPGRLPKIKGSDDATHATWIPLNVFNNMEDQLFEDHYHLVRQLVGKN